MLIRSIHPLHEKSIVLTVPYMEFDMFGKTHLINLAKRYFKETYQKEPENIEVIKNSDDSVSIAAFDEQADDI